MSALSDPSSHEAHPFENPEHSDAASASDPSDFDASEFTEIERGDTLVRIGLTLLFVLVNGVVNSLLGVLIVFELLWALVAKLPPSAQIRSFANRIVAFQYRVGRYLTYNESVVPFPFSEFPDEVEPGAFDPDRRDSEHLGLPSDWMERARAEGTELRERQRRRAARDDDAR